MIETIENQIIEALKQNKNFKGFEIAPFPEDFDDYRFLSAEGCMLVRYDGSIFSGPETLSAVTQSETYEFSIITGVRYQETLSKNYPILKGIKETLTGFQIREGKLYPKKCKYLGQKNRACYYGHVFAIKLKSFDKQKNSNIVELFN